jgi:hypothetical protein
MEKRFDAMMQAAKVLQPAVGDFYGSLSDDRKARYNNLQGQAVLSADRLKRVQTKSGKWR